MTTRPAAANLHYGDGNAEEVKDVRTDQKRGDEQQETVHGHLSRQGAARRPWVVPCKRQEYRAAAERIDDGKKRAQDEQYVFCGFEQCAVSKSVPKTGNYTLVWPFA